MHIFRCTYIYRDMPKKTSIDGNWECVDSRQQRRTMLQGLAQTKWKIHWIPWCMCANIREHIWQKPPAYIHSITGEIGVRQRRTVRKPFRQAHITPVHNVHHSQMNTWTRVIDKEWEHEREGVKSHTHTQNEEKTIQFGNNGIARLTFGVAISWLSIWDVHRTLGIFNFSYPLYMRTSM